MINGDDESTAVRRVKVLSPESLKEMRIESTPTIKAITETLLEVCDGDLEVSISEAELTVLTAIYNRLKTAQPFRDLHEALDNDAGLAIFYSDIMEVIKIEDLKLRNEGWVEAFKDFVALSANLGMYGTPWDLELRRYAQDHLHAYHQYQLGINKTIGGKFKQ